MKKYISHITRKAWILAFSTTARNTYMVFAGNIISAFFAFLFTVVLVRGLSFADFGYFSALLSFLLLVSDLTDIGIGSSLSAFIPKLEADRQKLLVFLKTSFFLQAGVAGTVSILIFFLSSFLSIIFFHTRDLTYLVQITSLGIFCTILANFLQYVLSARQMFFKVSILSSFGGASRFALLLLVLGFSTLNVDNALWAHTVMVILLLILAIKFVGVKFLKARFSISDLKNLISFTSFLGVARGLTALASRLDVLMLIALTNPTEAGIYSTASRVVSIYPLLSGSFSTVIAPKLTATTDRKRLKDFMIKVTIGTGGIVTTILVLILFAHPFITVLFGQKAESAVSVFQLLLLAMIFFVASIPVVSLAIYYLRKPHILSVNSIIQLFVVIIGNLFFIPRFGRMGTAYSLIIAYGITLFFTAYLVFIYLRKKHESE
ncbi:oligosaccharide flippase family protein [Candidatus Gottesmanbacteria bacterium]|nr:oligosaccharide flippase family protein [Candidatus Gottesmanbacteria bacterium]